MAQKYSNVPQVLIFNININTLMLREKIYIIDFKKENSVNIKIFQTLHNSNKLWCLLNWVNSKLKSEK